MIERPSNPLGRIAYDTARDGRLSGRSAAAAVRAARTSRRAARGRRRVVIGPWLSEVGFEVLYWIPFLRFLRDRHGLPGERAIVVSRGGTAAWYGSLCGDYVDLHELIDPHELPAWQERHRLELRGLKQFRPTGFDREILRRLSDRLGPEPFDVLHPSTMFRRFQPVWAGRRGVETLFSDVRFERLATADRPEAPADAPTDGYVTVKPYFSETFPDIPENRELIAEVVEGLARRTRVVVLTTGLKLDDHAEPATSGEQLRDVCEGLTPANNLALQTRLIHGSRGLVSTYGGFSYLGALLGVPTIALHSRPEFNPAHLTVFYHALRELGLNGSFSLLGTDQADLIDLGVARSRADI